MFYNGLCFGFGKKFYKWRFTTTVRAEKCIGARVWLGIATIEMTYSCGWSVELQAAWPDLIMIILYGGVAVCNEVTFVSFGTCEVFRHSSLSLDRPLDIPTRFKSIERKRKLFFTSPPLQHLLCFFLSSEKWWSRCHHCGSHFPKDYCHWPLPFGQSWHHSHCPWLQQLAGQPVGNRHSLSNPYSHIWELSGSSHRPSLLSLPLFLSVLSPMPVSCTTGPFSSVSLSQLNARIGH